MRFGHDKVTSPGSWASASRKDSLGFSGKGEGWTMGLPGWERESLREEGGGMVVGGASRREGSVRSSSSCSGLGLALVSRS